MRKNRHTKIGEVDPNRFDFVLGTVLDVCRVDIPSEVDSYIFYDW